MATEGPPITGVMREVLEVLLREPPGTVYGKLLCERMGRLTGTIYRTLAGLERIGWVESEWEEINPSEEKRPRRRLYRLTEAGGRGALAAAAELSAQAERLRVRPTSWAGQVATPPAIQ